MEPTLCLNCGNFPCICGDQYKHLSEYEYNELLKNLANLRDDVTVYRHGEDIVSIINHIPPEQKSLFIMGSEEVVSMPKDWKVFLQTNDTARARELIDKLTKLTIDEFTFPSGLIITILIKCQLSENTYVTLLKNWLQSCSDDVSFMIRSLLDDSAAYIKTSIDRLASFILGFNSVIPEDLGTIDKMRINAAITIKNLLVDLQDHNAPGASMNLMLFMSTLTSYMEKKYLVEYNSNWCDHNLDLAIYYIDESFRQFIDKTAIDLPLLPAY